MTHFGPYTDVRTHLAELLDQLDEIAAVVKRTLALEGTDDERIEAFAVKCAAGCASACLRPTRNATSGRGR